MVYRTGDNNFGVAKWIVDATAGQGTHTTIATALTSSASGDTIFIRPGTYTENLTLKAGVNLTAFPSDSSTNGTGKVIISGTCTLTTAGTVTISGIQLQTNSAALLAVTGTLASVVTLFDCYLNITNNTGITFSSSSASAQINIQTCSGDIGTTGIAFAAHSSAGSLSIARSGIGNSGASTTATTVSAGSMSIVYSIFQNPITTSSTGTLNSSYSTFQNIGNTTCLTVGGTSASIDYSSFTSGSASALSVSSGKILNLVTCEINSSNTNAITGAGTLNYSFVTFTGSSSGHNVTTEVNYATLEAAFTNVVIQKFTGNGTYTPTTGMKKCQIECVGGGGAGGGANITSAAQNSIGAGGGGGEYTKAIFSAATVGTSQAVTVGAGGTGVSAGTGNTGATTSVGALITAIGGSGGTAAASGATTGTAAGGIGGTGGTGSTVAIPGGKGGTGLFYFGQFDWGGDGGNSQLGANAPKGIINVAGGTVTGTAGALYGTGGTGAMNGISQAAATGGAGAAGIVVITEYI